MKRLVKRAIVRTVFLSIRTNRLQYLAAKASVHLTEHLGLALASESFSFRTPARRYPIQIISQLLACGGALLRSQGNSLLSPLAGRADNLLRGKLVARCANFS